MGAGSGPGGKYVDDIESEEDVKKMSPGDTLRFKLNTDKEIQLQITSSSDWSGNGKLLLSAKPIGVIGVIELMFPEGQLFKIGNLWFRWEKNREISILGAHGKENDREHC